MMEEIYNVIYPEKDIFADAYVMDPVYDPNSRDLCICCNRPVSGMEWCDPKSVKLKRSKMPDFLYGYGFDMPFLISEKVLSAYSCSNLSGILGYDKIEKIVSTRKTVTDNYFHIKVKRLDLPIDHKKSKIVYGKVPREKKCAVCDSVGRTKDFIYTLHLVMDNYDGTDIFKIYELGDLVFVSKRFLDFCQTHNFSNINVRQLGDYNRHLQLYFSDEQLQNMFGDD